MPISYHWQAVSQLDHHHFMLELVRDDISLGLRVVTINKRLKQWSYPINVLDQTQESTQPSFSFLVPKQMSNLLSVQNISSRGIFSVRPLIFHINLLCLLKKMQTTDESLRWNNYYSVHSGAPPPLLAHRFFFPNLMSKIDKINNDTLRFRDGGRISLSMHPLAIAPSRPSYSPMYPSWV